MLYASEFYSRQLVTSQMMSSNGFYIIRYISGD